MFHEIQVKKGAKYHYLSENIRAGRGKWKRVRIYLGKGGLSSGEIGRLVERNRARLERMVMAEKRETDPLLFLLSESQAEEIEGIRKRHNQAAKRMDRLALQNFYEWFVTQFTYDTNAIEGSSVTQQETGMILFEGIVPREKPIREIREVENHKAAFDYMFNYKGDISKRFVLELHRRFMHNILWKLAGVFRPMQVYIRGASLAPPAPGKVPGEFKGLMLWYGRNKRKYHPVVLAAYFHAEFERIHPFRDGNGRVGRLLLNFMLKKNGLPMVDIKNRDRLGYYNALQEAHEKGNLKPMAGLIVKCLKEGKPGLR